MVVFMKVDVEKAHRKARLVRERGASIEPLHEGAA